MYFSILYSLQGFLDKNRDLMRPDILSVLKNSNSRFIRDLLGKHTAFAWRSFTRCYISLAFVEQITPSLFWICFFLSLPGADPLAMYRWSILRSFFKAVHAFKIAGKQYRASKWLPVSCWSVTKPLPTFKPLRLHGEIMCRLGGGFLILSRREVEMSSCFTALQGSRFRRRERFSRTHLCPGCG